MIEKYLLQSMMELKKYTFFQILGMLGLTCFLFTCETPVDWELKPGDNGKLVIEAIITNEEKMQEVKLSLSYDDFNEKPQPVSDAVVRMYDGQNTVQFLEDPGNPGTFLSEIPFAAGLLKGYGLEVGYKGRQHLAFSYMVPVLPMETLTFQQIGETDSLRINYVASTYGVVEEAMYEIDIDWNHIHPSDSSRARVYYYTFNTVNASQLFSPPRQEVIFPRGSIVIEKKYSLNEEFADFLRNLVLETQWQGGVYEEESGSLPSNFSNGALGYFGLCAVKRDTLIAE
jgi:hypothetical protein